MATAIVKGNEDIAFSLSRIITQYKFIKNLLWNEFIFDKNKNDEEEINEVMAYFE